MTDLPKLSLGEFQNMMETLKHQNEKTQPTHRLEPVAPTVKKRRCPCRCAGCADPNTNANHCLSSPCTRQRNRRSPAEIAAGTRYDSGRARAENVTPRPTTGTRRVRSPEELEAAGRYPNGRAKPDRSGWTKPAKNSGPRETPLNPLRRTVEWFVSAQRNHTDVTLAAPEGRDEAYAMAGHLHMFGWTVKVIGP